MYAEQQYRQRMRKKRMLIGCSLFCILSIAIVCIAAKVTSDNQNKANMDKYNNGKPESSEDCVDNPVLKYFDSQDGADITWAHAVNNKSKLKQVMGDKSVMMLEADVILDNETKNPIMAHPPETKSDLTLKEFLDTVLKSDEKGLKLDFKETQALNLSLKILKEFLKGKAKLPPIILNADILQGPNSDNSTVVDAESFLKECSSFENVIISPGWKTGFNKGNITGYTTNNTDEMVYLLKRNAITQHVTFPIRASLIALNPKVMHLLLGQYQKKGSLTVWTSSKDTYNPADLAFLRLYKKQVFYDLPKKDVEEIKSAGDVYDWKKYSSSYLVPSSSKNCY